jgi:glycosyltransferase involved in cell wall biosynthesis
MSSRKDFKAIEKKLMSIPQEELQSITVPVRELVQDGENLHHWALNDRKELEAAGLSPEKIDELSIAADVLRFTEGDWFKVRYNREQDSELVNGYELRKHLVHAFMYAYRYRPEILSRVREVSSGNGHADMIQDLQNLKALGNENKEELESIKFDFSLLEKAAVTADTIAEHLGSKYADPQAEKNARNIRDRAYTYLKMLLTDVRECGKYVFYQNKIRYCGYVSQYHKRNRKNKKSVKTETVEVREAA